MHIPDDLLELIFRNCDARTLATLECVSKSFNEVSKRVPLRMCATPANYEGIATWLHDRRHRVVKLVARRLTPGVIDLFGKLEHLDIMHARVMDLYGPLLPPCLKFLRIHRLSRPFGAPVGKLLNVPESLEVCDLAFDDTFHRVELRDSKNVRMLRLRGVSRSLRQPDFVLGKNALRRVDALEITTPGSLVVVRPEPTTVRRAMLHVDDMYDVKHVLQLFGDALEDLTVVAPEAGLTTGDDLARVSPKRLRLEADFVGIDRIWDELERLDIAAQRLFSRKIPSSVDLRCVVRGAPIARSFFS